MRGDIGGEFYALPGKGSLPAYFRSAAPLARGRDKLLLNSGRAGILYFYTRYVRPRKLLLPAYGCPAMAQGIDTGCVDYYDVLPDLTVDLQSLARRLADDDAGAVLFINYFGFLQPGPVLKALRALRKKGVRLLEDTTDSIFTQRETAGDVCVCALRKWFALPDGAVLYGCGRQTCRREPLFTNPDVYDVRNTAFRLKADYIAGRRDEKEDFLALFRRGEALLSRQAEPRAASPDVVCRLRAENRLLLIRRRRANYAYLLRQLHNPAVKPLRPALPRGTVPLFFPVRCAQRDRLRQALAARDIFCPDRWPVPPGVDLAEFPGARALYQTTLPLPVDQRYTETDMARLADAVNRFRPGESPCHE